MSLRTFLLAGASVAISGIAVAQSSPAPKPSRDEVIALARAEVAIAKVRDSIYAQLAQQRNKKDEQQKELRARLKTQVTAVLTGAGMTEADYTRRMFVVATDSAVRRTFDSVVVAVSGTPLPSAPASASTDIKLPAGAVGTHVGHVVKSFPGTPGNAGLLPVGIAEARVALQHAQLAARQPTNLEYMKTHAAHVLNALDPSLAPQGPGQGYGVKKAATNVATHIELAAATAGSSPNVQVHAKHIATCARNTVVRADQMIALAQKVAAATTAAEAAALVSQMAALADALLNGQDANGDGRITTDPGEGGLLAADEHAKLMLAAERP